MKIKGKNLKFILTAVFMLSGIIVILTVLNSSVKYTIITSSKLRKAIPISELSTCAFFYNGVVSIPDKDNSEKIKYSVKYDSVVKAGIDAKNIDFKIDRKNKTISPSIPGIKITDVIIDDNSISTIPENTTAKLKDTLRYCKEDALNEVKQNSNLIETAKTNLQDSITALLMPIIKKSGYKIVW